MLRRRGQHNAKPLTDDALCIPFEKLNRAIAARYVRKDSMAHVNPLLRLASNK